MNTQPDQAPASPIFDSDVFPVLEEGKRLRNIGDMAGSRQHYQDAIALCREHNEPIQEHIALQLLGKMELDAANFEIAYNLFRKSCDYFFSIDRKDLSIASISGLGYIYQVQGQYDLARSTGEEALAIARECGNRRLEAAMLGNLGVLCLELKEIKQASSFLEQALIIHRADGNRDLEAQCLIDMVKVHTFSGKLDDAIATATEAVALTQELNMKNAEGVAHSAKGLAFLQANRWREGAAEMRLALTILREIGNRRFVIITLTNLGLALQNDNQPEEAEAAYREVIGVCRQYDDHHSMIYALMNLGALMMAQEKLEDAERYLLESIDILRGSKNIAILGVALFDLAILNLARNDWAQVNDCVDQALGLSTEWISVEENPLLYTLGASCKAAIGDWEMSDKLYEQLPQVSDDEDWYNRMALLIADGYRAYFRGNYELFDQLGKTMSELSNDHYSHLNELGILYDIFRKTVIPST